jgi:hypothetical protein
METTLGVSITTCELLLKISNATWYSLTDCRTFTPYLSSKLNYGDHLKDIIADYLSSQTARIKRDILNLGGVILKLFFGSLTQSDAKKYTLHIQKLEDEHKSF